jgi:hypothetical protein
MTYYKLILTHQERRAIDFVGYRYPNGDDFCKLLLEASWELDVDWSDPTDIIFEIPEHLAWEIRDLLVDDQLTLFADELRVKIYDFCFAVV